MSRWPMVPLGDLCVQDRQQTKESSLPYIGLEHVVSGSGEILFDGDNPITVNGTSFIFDNRHVLYGKLRPYLNKVVLPDFQGRCSMELIPLRPNPGVLREFVAAVLRHPNTISLAVGRNTGSRMPRADMRQVLAMPAPIPPLDEQRRIVDLLNRAAGIRRLREQALATARNTIPALFLQTFGDPATNPKGWPVVELGTLGELDRGKSRHRPRNDPQLLGGPHPFLQTGDVANSNGIIERFASTYSDFGLAQSRKWPKGTLCITIAANIAATGVLQFDACFPDSVVGFRPGPSVTSEYVQAIIDRAKGVLEQNAPQAAQKNINLKILRALPTPLPPLHLQRRFADRLADLRGIVTQQERALATARTLERALLARLLE